MHVKSNLRFSLDLGLPCNLTMRNSNARQRSAPVDLDQTLLDLDLDDDGPDDLHRRIPHQFCFPRLYTSDINRNALTPGHGPFYVVMSGRKEGVFTSWCVYYLLPLDVKLMNA